MAYVPIPKDLSNVKTKVAFGLTKRQLLLAGVGIVLGLIAFFIFKPIIGTSNALYPFMAFVLPAFFIGLFKKNGLTFEQYFSIRRKYNKSKKIRTFKSKNFYEYLEKGSEN